MNKKVIIFLFLLTFGHFFDVQSSKKSFLEIETSVPQKRLKKSIQFQKNKQIRLSPNLVQKKSHDYVEDAEEPEYLTQDEAKNILQGQIEPKKNEIEQNNQKIQEDLNELNGTKQNNTLMNQTENMDQKIDSIDYKVKENSIYTMELSILIDGNKLSEKQQELEQLETDITNLKQQIPEDGSTCNHHHICSECTKDVNCGWCEMEQKCVKGDNIGPLKISCNYYNYKYCSGKNCYQYQDCNSCLNQISCGWCDDEETFIKGCMDVENQSQPCPATGWYQQESENDICIKEIIAEQSSDLDGLSQERKWELEDKICEKNEKKQPFDYYFGGEGGEGEGEGEDLSEGDEEQESQENQDSYQQQEYQFNDDYISTDPQQRSWETPQDNEMDRIRELREKQKSNSNGREKLFKKISEQKQQMKQIKEKSYYFDGENDGENNKIDYFES